MMTFYLTGLKIPKQIKILHQILTGVHLNLNVSYLVYFLTFCVMTNIQLLLSYDKI